MTTQNNTIWRESASLILVSKLSNELEKVNKYSYELLLLKRSERTAFATNQTVFPGGRFEPADQAVAWLKYFEEFGVSQDSLRQLLIISDDRPKILLPQGNGCYDRFFKKSYIWAREISLRLTAIRETFEEVGILLCRTSEQLDIQDNAGCAYVYEEFDKAYWQQKIHNDPSKFLELCRHLNVIPDLWGLYEWSAWASPAPVKKGNETVFFIAFVQQKPSLLPEASEVKECIWRTPGDLLQMYSKGDVWFMPPQVYEISRCRNVVDFVDLLNFAKQRSTKGITLYLPVGYLCTDGMVTVLPGDDFYRDDPRSETSFRKLEMTMAEFRSKAKKLHRFDYAGPTLNVLLNFDPPNGHLPIASTPRNKL